MWISKKEYSSLISKLDSLKTATNDINLRIEHISSMSESDNKIVSVLVENKSSNPLPSYSTSGSAGMDLRAFLTEPVVILPSARALIPTGLHIQLPEGFEAQIRPRSGLAIKKGITVLNSPGTIDSDYLGEICIILINNSTESFTVNNGDRIAQMVISSYVRASFKGTTVFTETERGEGGFGHTGIK